MEPFFISYVTLDCPDPETLSKFYLQLLGWEIRHASDEFVSITSPACTVSLGFQKNEDYVPPVWPEEPGRQQQMVHVDFKAKDKEEMKSMVAHALECGARHAWTQDAELWTVLLDPVGHPFCIDTL